MAEQFENYTSAEQFESYAAVDIEWVTTAQKEQALVQIGAVKVSPQEKKQLAFRIYPETVREITRGQLAFMHINAEELLSGEEEMSALTQLEQWLSDCPLLVLWGSFNCRIFLEKMMPVWATKGNQRKIADAQQLYSELRGESCARKIGHCCEAFGVTQELPEHDALKDAQTLSKVIPRLFEAVKHMANMPPIQRNGKQKTNSANEAYYINPGRNVFHLAGCRHLSSSSQRRQESCKSLKKKGYLPCKHCWPQEKKQNQKHTQNQKQNQKHTQKRNQIQNSKSAAKDAEGYLQLCSKRHMKGYQKGSLFFIKSRFAYWYFSLYGTPISLYHCYKNPLKIRDPFMELHRYHRQKNISFRTAEEVIEYIKRHEYAVQHRLEEAQMKAGQEITGNLPLHEGLSDAMEGSTENLELGSGLPMQALLLSPESVCHKIQLHSVPSFQQS